MTKVTKITKPAEVGKITLIPNSPNSFFHQVENFKGNLEFGDNAYLA